VGEVGRENEGVFEGKELKQGLGGMERKTVHC
jgi:hypothetical protein